jgi:hypothetical protein
VTVLTIPCTRLLLPSQTGRFIGMCSTRNRALEGLAMSTDSSSQYPETRSSDPGNPEPHPQRPVTPASHAQPSITDPYLDVLEVLSPQARRGLIAQLAVGFYDGWRPSRGEVADLVAVKLGILTVDECERRRQLRNNGYRLPEIDVTTASPKVDLPRHPRTPPPRRERNHPGQWTNHHPPGEQSHAEPPDHEGQY